MTNDRKTSEKTPFYFSGNRQLQQQFSSTKLADRLEKIIVHPRLSAEEQTFISSLDMFFISTINEAGQPSVSYKGGAPGFVKTLDDHTLAFPGYDGNGMFLTAGNVLTNPQVGLLFMSVTAPHRLRVQGSASIDLDDPLLKDYHQAQYVVRIAVSTIFMNCSRYIHGYQQTSVSEFVPRTDCETPDPQWKSEPILQDVLPPK